MQCKYCGCTDENACTGGCSWSEPEVCSKCIELHRARAVIIQRGFVPLAKKSVAWMMELIELAENTYDLVEATAFLTTYDHVAAHGHLPTRDELRSLLAQEDAKRQTPPPQIIIATEADVPPFLREHQL